MSGYWLSPGGLFFVLLQIQMLKHSFPFLLLLCPRVLYLWAVRWREPVIRECYVLALDTRSSFHLFHCPSRKALNTFLNCVAKVSAVLRLWQQRMFDVASRVQTLEAKCHAAEKVGAIKRQRSQRSHSLQSPDYHIDRHNGCTRNLALGSIQLYFGASLHRPNRVLYLVEEIVLSYALRNVEIHDPNFPTTKFQNLGPKTGLNRDPLWS